MNESTNGPSKRLHDMNTMLSIIENSLYSLKVNDQLTTKRKLQMISLAHDKILETIDLWTEIKDSIKKGNL